MESLNSLAKSLESKDGHSLEQNEQALTKDFRAAALSITTLYRSSLQASKRAYDAGYSACLADVLNFIQQGVSSSVGDLSATEEEWQRDASKSMTVGRVMDWIEARLDAIGGKDEDEQEEVDQHPPPHRSRAPPGVGVRNEDHPSSRRQKDIPIPIPVEHPQRQPSPTALQERRSMTPPVPASSPLPRSHLLPLPKRKARGRSKDVPALQPLGHSSIPNASSPFTFSLPTSVSDDMSLVNSPLSAFTLPDTPPTPYTGLGSKRRHSEVTPHPPPPHPTSGNNNTTAGCTPRSQKRRNRGSTTFQQQASDGMDMEEDSGGGGGRGDRRKQIRR